MADDLYLPLLGFQEVSDEDDSETPEEEMEVAAAPITEFTYDVSLPAQHRYLGTDLEELSGYTMLDDSDIMELPLLSLPGIILIPQQSLPLHIFHPATIATMKKIVASNRIFGIVNQRYGDPMENSTLSPLGTTAEIRSFKEEIDDDTSIGTLRVKAEGRQRFKIIESRRQMDGMLLGKVVILPEITLGDPLAGARLQSCDRFAIAPPNFDRLTTTMENQGGKCMLKMKSTRTKYDRFRCSHFTPWPGWVYKLYDEKCLMKTISKDLKNWHSVKSASSQPEKATEFSFWVAANLPLDDSLRLNLLALNSPIQRLRCEMSILNKNAVLGCRRCGSEITGNRDIFSMSVEGPQGNYVNSFGYVHETVTVTRAKGLYLSGRPSVESSWFPGYAWTVAHCSNCRNHIGWKFTVVDKKLKPEWFWGLSRSALKQAESPEDIHWQPVM